MREYEFTFVVQPEITEEGLETLCGKFEAVLERSHGIRLFYEDWGRRRLAYEIQKFQKGHYLVMHYLDQGTTVPELERTARLEDSVLRFLTVLADDDVADIEGRKAESVKLEDERKQKAIERAAREAEEAAARAAEAEEAAARSSEAAARAEQAAADAASAEDAAGADEDAAGADENAAGADENAAGADEDATSADEDTSEKKPGETEQSA